MSHLIYIGIGSNLNEPLENCRRAMDHLSGHSKIKVTAHSSFYKTEPVGKTDQDWFINTVVEARTSLSPPDLLKELLSIENNMGRERLEKWGPRIIDLDLLFYDDRIENSDTLTLPHPEIQFRKFVLAPLCEISGEIIHPVLNISVQQLLAELPDSQTVFRV